jgi:predicted amidohydrolase YtcJ
MRLIELFGDLQKAGAKVAYGNNWPVDPLDPFLALTIPVVLLSSITLQSRN